MPWAVQNQCSQRVRLPGASAIRLGPWIVGGLAHGKPFDSARGSLGASLMASLSTRPVDRWGPRSWQAFRLGPWVVRASLMASLSTRPVGREGLAHGKPFDSQARAKSGRRAEANGPERAYGCRRVEGQVTSAWHRTLLRLQSSSAPTGATTSAPRPTCVSANGHTTKGTARSTQRHTDRCAWCTQKPTSPGLLLASAKHN
jgi:hypothetical protein